MAIDFLSNDCDEKLDDVYFGLCDNMDIPPDPPTPAYVKAYQEEDWLATVNNEQRKLITFTAIDHCVISNATCDPRPEACDCMLTYDNALAFVELKDRRMGGWWEKSLSQLFETIKIFKDHHDMTVFESRKAYISNKARPNFVVSRKTEKNRFEDNTSFELLTQSVIVI